MPLAFPKLTLSPMTQALIIFAVSAAGIHFGGIWLKQKVLAAPTAQVLQRDPPAQALITKVGAINVIQEDKIEPQTSPTTIGKIPADLPNQLFSTVKALPDSHEAREVDYFAQIPDHVHLDAITHNGVVINGKFVGIGEPLYDRAYPPPGADPTDVDNFIAARVISASGKTATLREPVAPHRTIHLSID